MNDSIAFHIGSLLLDESQSAPYNVFDNLTSGIHPSGNLQQSQWNFSADTSKYTYLRYKHDIAQPDPVVGAAMDYFFRPNIFTYPVLCTYPISGQYGYLNRLLFYLLLMFALVVRKRTWLAVAAIGTAMTYAASAATHAFALLVRYKYKTPPNDFLDHSQDFKPMDLGDLDLQDIFPILVASGVLLTPILQWSTEIREQGRAIAVCWGVITFAALVPTFAEARKMVFPLVAVGQVATCEVEVSKNCTMDWFASTPHAALLADVFKKCNCNDTCGAVSLPRAPFRRGQGLQVLLFSERTAGAVTMAWNWVHVIGPLLLCFIIVQGILGLWQVSFTRAELRNKLFLLLNGKRVGKPRSPINVRYYLATIVALFFYIGAIVVALVSPIALISSVVYAEYGAWIWPVAEKNNAVGQWSTYVGAAFVVIAAVIQRYYLIWRDLLSASAPEVLCLCLGIRSGERMLSGPDQAGEKCKETDNMLEQNHHFLLRRLTAAGKSIHRSWHRVKEEWKDFKEWWKNPIDRSHQPHYRSPSSSHKEWPPLHGSYVPRAKTAPGSFSSSSSAAYSNDAGMESLSLLLSNRGGTPLHPLSPEYSFSDDLGTGYTLTQVST